ncbi:hypothetical protein OAT11_05395 [Nitrospinaceae bacterium]|nr:hypothetical protein [Nitrospinaceae bacterium]
MFGLSGKAGNLLSNILYKNIPSTLEADTLKKNNPVSLKNPEENTGVLIQ